MISGQRRTGKAVVTPKASDRTLWVVLFALAAFGGSLFSGFHFDDYGMLQDAAIVSPEGWRRCWGLLQTRPLTWFSFWMNYQISGREPMLWHAVNVVLHVGCSVVLYRLLTRVMPAAALWGALIFALHPVQSEPVDYVYARAIVLCALCSVATMGEWISGRVWRSAAWFALALLAKEECVTVPLVLALYSFSRGELRRRALPLSAMLGMAALAGVRVTAAIRITGMKNIGVNAGVSPLEYLSAQGIAILRYFGLIIFPWAFSVDPQIPSLAWWWRVLAWLVVAGLIAAAALRFREARASFWILAGLILLIPSSSVFAAADLAADRRLYLPMLAFAPAIALLLPSLRMRWLAAAAFVLTLLSMERTYVWSWDGRLWGEAVRLAPEKVRPRIQLARAVSPAQGLVVLEEAKTIAPQDADVATELARVELELGRPAEALAEAGRALALRPRDPHALNNRGAVLLALQQAAAARRDFAEALRLDPCLEEARANLERSGGVPAEVMGCGQGRK
jgi:tetratricopeptide (TPR) repeat protein